MAVPAPNLTPGGAVSVSVSPSAGATLENVPGSAVGRLRTGITSDVSPVDTVNVVPRNVLAVMRYRVCPWIGAPLVGRKVTSSTTVMPGPMAVSKVVAIGLP